MRVNHPVINTTLLLAVSVASPAWGDEPLQISLHPTATVPQAVVRVQDVATVSGGDPDLRRRVGALDVGELPDEHPAVAFSATRIAARLAIAGVSSHDYEITGADVCMAVRGQDQSADQAVLNAVRQALAARFGVPADNMRVRLTRPLARQFAHTIASLEAPHIEVLLPTHLTLGNATVTLRLLDDARLVDTSPLPLFIELRQDVLVTRRGYAAGTRLDAEDVAVEERFVAQPTEELTPPDVADRLTRRALAPGEIVTSQKLHAPRPARVQPLVRPRDSVRLVARLRGLQVSLSAAEVLQAGGEGDLVRVRNLESGRTVVGRVVNAELVEVPLSE